MKKSLKKHIFRGDALVGMSPPELIAAKTFSFAPEVTIVKNSKCMSQNKLIPNSFRQFQFLKCPKNRRLSLSKPIPFDKLRVRRDIYFSGTALQT
jgi:hypothetical protein